MYNSLKRIEKSPPSNSAHGMINFHNKSRFHYCFIQQKRDRMENVIEVSNDQIRAAIEINQQPTDLNRKLGQNQLLPPTHAAPIFQAGPKDYNKANEPIATVNNKIHKIYQLSTVRVSVFIVLTLIPLISLGVSMGTCPKRYQNKQVCQSQYSSYYYSNRQRMSQVQCCFSFQIFFWIWFGSFCTYLLANILVRKINPPSMNQFFRTILFYQIVDSECFCYVCPAILCSIFLPIVTVITIISAIIYCLSQCLEKIRSLQD